MAEWFSSLDAGIVDEELDGKIIRTVNNKVVFLDDIESIGCLQKLSMCFYLYMRVDGIDRFLRRFNLPLVHIGSRVDDLALQVAEVNHVVIYNADGANAGRRQVHGNRGTQSACTNDEYFAFAYLLLTFHTDILQKNVAEWKKRTVAISRLNQMEKY